MSTWCSRPKLIALASVALVMIVAMAVFCLSPREPWHKGQPLSHWLDQLQVIEVYPTPGSTSGWGSSSRGIPSHYSDLSEEEIKVVMKRGAQAATSLADLDTNALPAIIARLGARDSKMDATIRNFRLSLRRFGWETQSSKPTLHEQRGQALAALEILRHRAGSTVPDLIQLSKSDDAQIRASAAYALEEIFADEYRNLKQ